MEDAVALKKGNLDSFQIIANEVMRSLEDCGVASEELLRDLCTDVAHRVYKRTLETISDCAFMESVDSFFNYADFDEVDEYAFDMGVCWGAVTVLRNAVFAKEQDLVSGMLKSLLHSYKQLFFVLNERPGIRHAALAHQLGYSPSRLSQIMPKLVSYDLVSSVKIGREKAYFITERTRVIISELKQNAQIQMIKEAFNKNWRSGRQEPREIPNTISNVPDSNRSFLTEYIDKEMVNQATLSKRNKGNSTIRHFLWNASLHEANSVAFG